MKALILTAITKGKINQNFALLLDATTKICDYCDVLILGHNLTDATNKIANINKICTFNCNIGSVLNFCYRKKTKCLFKTIAF